MASGSGGGIGGGGGGANPSYGPPQQQEAPLIVLGAIVDAEHNDPQPTEQEQAEASSE